MIKAAEHITEVLQLPGIASEIEGSFWELAEAGTNHPFVNFGINDLGPATRDGIRDYNIQLRIYAKSLTEGSRIGEVIQREIKASSYNWKDRGGRSTYSDGEAKEAFIELTFEFKV